MAISGFRIAVPCFGMLLTSPIAAQGTERVSVASDGVQGNGYSSPASISADGRFVAFQSDSSNLVAGDTNGQSDIFVRDRQGGTTRRMSLASNGDQADSYCFNATISADGRYVAFTSLATNLVPGDTNGKLDVFVRDRLAATTERVSVDSGGVRGNDDSAGPRLSSDGRFVAFQSLAGNLVPGDLSVSAQSAAKGDTIQPGQPRWYTVYYRDPIVLGGCAASSTFNATQTGQVSWSF